MKPQYTRKLASARKTLKSALKELHTANNPHPVFKKARRAHQKTCRAWLIKTGRDWSKGKNRFLPEDLFDSLAPEYLLRKFALIGSKISALSQKLPYSPQISPNAQLTNEEWKKETAICLRELIKIIDHVDSGCELNAFKGEVARDFLPGQWVHIFSLRNHPDGSSFWNRKKRKILAVKGHNLILRGPNRTLETRNMCRLLIVPSSPQIMGPGFPSERRLEWFDLHPEFRQNPLFFKNKGDFGSSLFYTCPCCGYPVLNTHPVYLHRDLDDFPFWYEICLLCDWADIEEGSLEDERSAPESTEENFNISLAEARLNFERYTCIFFPGQEPFFSVNTAPEILQLKQSITTGFDQLREESSQWKAYLLWHQIESARQSLGKKLKEAEHRHPEYQSVQHDEEGFVSGRCFANKWDFQPERSILGQWALRHGLGPSKTIWAGGGRYGHSRLIRLASQKGKDVINSIGGGTISHVSWCVEVMDRPHDDETTPRALRRNWFDVHRKDFKEKFTCACCGFPTMDTLAKMDACYLCDWVDTGQDDFEVFESLPDFNGGYTLAQARKNFESFLCIWAPKDLSNRARKHLRPETIHLKKEINDLFYTILESTEPGNCNLLWQELFKRIENIKKT